MKIEFFSEPVPFYIVRDYLSKEERRLCLNELLKMKPTLQSGVTRGATNHQGVVMKQNIGAWVDSQHPISKFNDKLKGPIAWETRDNWFYKMLTRGMKYSTLVSYYENEDYYLPHTDESIITAIMYLWEDPKTFTGGELCFGDFTVPIEDNCMVIFPSITEHSVNPLHGYGRWAVTHFMHEYVAPEVQQIFNVFSVSLHQKVQDFIKQANWTFMGSYWRVDLNNIELFSKNALEVVYGLTGQRLKVRDIYACGQLYGQNIATEVNGTTFVLHTNSIEDDDISLWGGKTAEKNPYQNSGVLIKPNNQYSGMGPSRLVNDLKVTIVWTFY
jgi:predicted 2-oxoglutarate/Fe(II)-dependent dioxygenase YbiX